MISRKIIHEKYHGQIRLQRRIISRYDFTYWNATRIVDNYIKKEGSILDIGSGAGTLDFYLANKGFKILGIDISQKAIKMAKLNSKVFGLDNLIDFKVMSYPKKIPKGKFDYVLISEVLEHINDDNEAVKALRNVMNSGSIVIASSPLLTAPLFKLGLLSDFDARVGHVRRYSQGDFKNLFRRNGFQILNTFEVEGPLRNLLFTNNIAGSIIKFLRWPLSSFVSYIDNLLMHIFGASNYYVVARKK